MPIRLIELPNDLVPLGDLIAESFQYPENPAWSVQSDEKDQILDAVRNLRRLWPLVRVIQVLSPTLRDILRGCIWEEDGRAVGTTIVQRRGSTSVWIIGPVSVLPEYRRRGIARKLVEKGLDIIRERGGEKAILSVIEGNLPAYTLYEKLGFEHYNNDIILESTPESAPPVPNLGVGYAHSPISPFDWKPRYELEKRILPESLQRYEPVEVGRFRRPGMMRLLLPILLFAQGQHDEEFVIRARGDGKVVARGGYTIPTRGKGLNNLRARLDPEHPELAEYLVKHLLSRVVSESPGLRVEFPVGSWMEPMVRAAEEAGFEKRMEHCRMGVVL